MADITVGPGGDFQTIQEAVDAASAGDNIIVSAGTYVEQVSIVGPTKNNITITNAPGEAVLVKMPQDNVAEGQTLGGIDLVSLFHVSNADGVTIEGMTLRGENLGSGNTEFAAVSVLESDGVVVDDVVITRFRYGQDEDLTSGFGRAVYAASTDPTDEFTLSNSIIRNYNKSAVITDGVVAMIDGNRIVGGGSQDDVAQNGIELFDSSGDVLDNNIVELNFNLNESDVLAAATGISAVGSSDLFLEGNRVVASGAETASEASQGGFIGISVLGQNGNAENIVISDSRILGNRDTDPPVQPRENVSWGFSTGDVENILIVDNFVTDVLFGVDILGFNDVDPPVTLLDNQFENVFAGLTLQPDPVDTPGQPFNVVGTNANDSMDGANSDDTLLGEDGDDILNGFDGLDTLVGGNGDDTAVGGQKQDYIEGGDDRDQLFGQQHIDTLIGGDDRDTLNGGDGRDSLVGGDGNDKLVGGTGENDGRDTLLGGNGQDQIFGGLAADRIFGGNGADTLVGNEGNDAFRYTRLRESTVDQTDIIRDFTSMEDKVYLNELENVAPLSFTGNNGTDDFTGVAGQVRVAIFQTFSYIQVDRTGNEMIDMQIRLNTTVVDASVDIVI